MHVEVKETDFVSDFNYVFLSRCVLKDIKMKDTLVQTISGKTSFQANLKRVGFCSILGIINIKWLIVKLFNLRHTLVSNLCVLKDIKMKDTLVQAISVKQTSKEFVFRNNKH